MLWSPPAARDGQCLDRGDPLEICVLPHGRYDVAMSIM
jgi:hypothetical protein